MKWNEKYIVVAKLYAADAIIGGMESKKWTLAQFADNIGISLPKAAKMISGMVNFTLREMIEIEVKMGINLIIRKPIEVRLKKLKLPRICKRRLK
jgi:hypothetical protein